MAIHIAGWTSSRIMSDKSGILRPRLLSSSKSEINEVAVVKTDTRLFNVRSEYFEKFYVGF